MNNSAVFVKKGQLKKDKYWLARSGFDHLRLNENLKVFFEQIDLGNNSLVISKDLNWCGASLSKDDLYHLENTYSHILLKILDEKRYKLCFNMIDPESAVKSISIYFGKYLDIDNIELEFNEHSPNRLKMNELLV